MLETMPQLVAPAVQLAREGFPLYHDLHQLIADNTALLARFPATAALFLRRNASSGAWQPKVAEGEPFAQPQLAATMEMLAAPGGVDAFYNGSLGAEIVAAARNATAPGTGKRGLLAAADLRGFRAVRRPPTGPYLKV